MEILVIDGQGGGLGRQLVAALRKAMPGAELMAVGTNSAATEAMRKAGASRAATGENAVAVACRRADVIVGPLGSVMADALLGEITPAMALAVARSRARRVLVPTNRCDTLVVGVAAGSLTALVQQAGDEGPAVCGGRSAQGSAPPFFVPQKNKGRTHPAPLPGNRIPSAVYPKFLEYSVFLPGNGSASAPPGPASCRSVPAHYTGCTPAVSSPAAAKNRLKRRGPRCKIEGNPRSNRKDTF